MASSANFLKEVLSISADADESASSALAGSLGNQIDLPISVGSCQQVSVNGDPSLLHVTDIKKEEPASPSNHDNAVVNGPTVLNSDLSKAVPVSCAQPDIIEVANTVSTAQAVVPNSNFIAQAAVTKTPDGLKPVVASNQLSVTSNGPQISCMLQNAASLPNGTLSASSTLSSTISGVSNSIAQGMVSQSFPQVVGTNYQKIIPASSVDSTAKSGAAVISKPTTVNNIISGASSQVATLPLSAPQMNSSVAVARPAITATGASTGLVNNTSIVLNLNNLRPTAAPASTGNRATTPQRVMIPNTIVRPGQPGQISLQTLQNLNNAGQNFLVKTENGQYHIVRLATPPVGSANTTNNATTIPAGNFRFAVPASNATVVNSPTTTVQSVTTSSSAQSITVQRAVDNSKEKCRKFLTNLLELSSKEPKAVERNVRTLIQELIDSQVEPEEFCNRLERLLNASPQPCLIGFLRRSLPGLRAAMTARELSIDGIRPPPGASGLVASASSVNQLSNQVRPVLGPVQQLRLALPQTPPSGIARPQQQIQSRIITPVRIPSVAAVGTAPIGGVKMVTTPNIASIATNAVRIPTSLPTNSLSSDSPGSSSNAAITPVGSNSLAASTFGSSPSSSTAMKFNTPSRPTIPKAPSKLSGANIPKSSGSNTKTANTARSSASKSSTLAGLSKQQSSAGLSKAALAKEKKSTAAAAAASSITAPVSSGGFVGDDDVNDVAAMAGVNLAEESQRILGPSEFVGTQIRSCKDETFLHTYPLTLRIQNMVAKHGFSDDPNLDVVAVVSHAAQERLKCILEKLNVIAEHRVDFNKADKNYEVSHDIKGQLRCLEELDKVERKRHDEMERELLLRAAKSRSKSEDPEQVKLKAKAKELQRAEMEELKQREANLTALQAIGPRKKIKLENDSSSSFGGNSSSVSGAPRLSLANRPRLKRVTLRDFLYVMEKEKNVRRSSLLYKSYLK